MPQTASTTKDQFNYINSFDALHRRTATDDSTNSMLSQLHHRERDESSKMVHKFRNNTDILEVEDITLEETNKKEDENSSMLIE